MEKKCPLMNGPCIEHGCRFYVQLLGRNPQTGAEMNRWDCTFSLLPMILLENSKTQRETGAAVDSLRNEVAAGAGTILMKALGLRHPSEQLEEKPNARLGNSG